jgi:hypothetical protein
MSAFRESATFARFDATAGNWMGVHQRNFFSVKIWLRVLFTNFQLGLGNSAISCLKIDGLLFSSFNIALAMSERGPSVGEVTGVYLVSLILANPIFHGLYRMSIPRIDSRAFSCEFTSHAILWSDNKVWSTSGQSPYFECRYLIVPEVPDFSAGVSQYLLINITLHKESDDSRLTSS